MPINHPANGIIVKHSGRIVAWKGASVDQVMRKQDLPTAPQKNSQTNVNVTFLRRAGGITAKIAQAQSTYPSPPSFPRYTSGAGPFPSFLCCFNKRDFAELERL